MSENKDTLVFVFNTYNDILSSVKDYFHRSFSPSTYKCNLSAVLTGPFGMKSSWKKFTEKLPLSVDFLHKDEFQDNYEVNGADFPAIYLNQDDELKLFITKEEIDTTDSVEELKTIIYDRMVQFGL